MDDEEIPADVSASSGRPWLTILLSLVAMGAYLLVQSLVYGFFLAAAMRRDPQLDAVAWMEQNQDDATIFSLATCLGALACVPLIMLFAHLLRRGGYREVLSLRWPSARAIVAWVFVSLLLIAIVDGLAWWRGGEIVPPFMRHAYRSATYPALLWLAIVVAAPLVEEFLFRGLLLRGLEQTWFGLAGGAVVTSLLWALLHVQYDVWGVALIFCGGLYLVAAKQSTGSLVTCIALHIIVNFVATVETAVAVNVE